jgi:hypothetical protein
MKLTPQRALLALAALSVPALGGDAPAPARSFELEVQVGATALRAENLSATPFVLVLKGRHDSRLEHIVVPPHSSFESRFTPLVLRELELTVVGRDAAGAFRSAHFDLSALRNRAFESLWFDVERGEVSAWRRAEHGFAGVSTRGDDNGQNTTCSNVSMPAHVPVITPRDGQGQDAAPRLQRRPLPPV